MFGTKEDPVTASLLLPAAANPRWMHDMMFVVCNMRKFSMMYVMVLVDLLYDSGTDFIH